MQYNAHVEIINILVELACHAARQLIVIKLLNNQPLPQGIGTAITVDKQIFCSLLAPVLRRLRLFTLRSSGDLIGLTTLNDG